MSVPTFDGAHALKGTKHYSGRDCEKGYGYAFDISLFMRTGSHRTSYILRWGCIKEFDLSEFEITCFEDVSKHICAIMLLSTFYDRLAYINRFKRGRYHFKLFEFLKWFLTIIHPKIF